MVLLFAPEVGTIVAAHQTERAMVLPVPSRLASTSVHFRYAAVLAALPGRCEPFLTLEVFGSVS